MLDTAVFCQNIKRLREKNRLSKQQMARILHIGTKSLTMLENGTIPPRMDVAVLIYISEHFDVRPDMLFLP